MKFGSVCSGIEAASVAWNPIGWETAWVSEIESFPCAVLEHHFPDVPNLGDVTKILEQGRLDGTPDIDILVGGTPCVDVSIAGKRAGLDGERSHLFFDFIGIARETNPRWLAWENVPGVLSSNGRRDFGTIIREMVGLGYGVCWRILNAEYVRVRSHPRAVPQRRRRVFVLGYRGDWRPAVAVLLNWKGMSGDSLPRRETREGITALTKSGVGTCGADDNQAQGGHLRIYGGGRTSGERDSTTSMSSSNSRLDFDTETFVLFDPRNQDVLVSGDIAAPLDTKNPPSSALATPLGIRRITPLEAERLQGFPDYFTLVPYRNGMAKDTPRYKALGNSMAINVMRYIGERIQMVHDIIGG